MTQKNNFCIYCGNKLLPEDKFCNQCGKEVNPQTTQPFSRVDIPLDNSERTTVAGAVVGTAAAATQTAFPTSTAASQTSVPVANQPTTTVPSASIATPTSTINAPSIGSRNYAQAPSASVDYSAAATTKLNTASSDNAANAQTRVMSPAQQANQPQATRQVQGLGKTAEIPVQTSQPVSYRQEAPAASKESKDYKKTILIVVVAALVLIALVFAGFAIGATFSSSDNNTNNTKTETPATAEDKTGAQPTTQPEEKKTVSDEDKKIYDNLLDYYNRLETYDSEIKTRANEFNSNYLKESFSLRQDYFLKADDTYIKISNSKATLASYSVPTSSAYYQNYVDILRCYDDCEHRISVIEKAWTISLQYSNPKGHESEITAPISADNDGKTNKYKKDFDSLYPSCKPVKP